MCESPVIVGIDDISNYLKRSRGVVRKLIQEGELPVALKHGAYMTAKQLLDDWLKQEITQNSSHMT